MEDSKVLIDISSDVLSLEKAIEFCGDPGAGAISSFSGTTRNNFNGKNVLKLKYKAYEPMAKKEMRKIADEVKRRWDVIKVAIVHRIGVVPIGESSVIIVVSSAHRRESLEAVSFAIDELKAKVPVWKKEYYDDSKTTWKENSECCMPSYSSGLNSKTHSHSHSHHSESKEHHST
eukprot:TRINITY_DN5567_c0_g1_i1.p1 TRINITY_DN5567_c0_g1~~TRINITY_DN5567_c0_g1_i1.p1  ORF type:complete len:175 (+),score=67.54 TRINITY_DN5567_c0_g1_i1:744-1268(+)